MKRVDQWEMVAAVASFACRRRTVRGVRYAMNPYRVAVALDKLSRIATTLRRVYTDMCNGTIGNSEWILDQSKADRYASRLESRAALIGQQIGIVVTCQRDPRGAPIKLWADREDGRALGVLVGGGR